MVEALKKNKSYTNITCTPTPFLETKLFKIQLIDTSDDNMKRIIMFDVQDKETSIISLTDHETSEDIVTTIINGI